MKRYLRKSTVPKDYYDVIVGIIRGANLSHIKRAYPRIANLSLSDSTHERNLEKFQQIHYRKQ
jgi:DnaJ-class molecular chaperone